MPELPEVEIVRQSLNKKIQQKKVKKVIIRNKNLRLKIQSNFNTYFLNKKIREKKVKKVLVRNRNLRKKVPLNFESFFLNQKILKV